MIRISELKVVENAIFRQNLNYNKVSLYPFIEKNFSEDKTFDKTSLNKIKNLIEQTGKDALAHNVLLNKDLKLIAELTKKEHLSFNLPLWKPKLKKIHDLISEYTGLKFKLREVNFCDSFNPESKNMELRGASTITVFEGSLNSGIYYLNKRVDNTSTAIHLIHEQVHTCLSQNKNKDQIFIEWFEEGVAIYYSLKIYFELTKDIDSLNAYRERSYIFSKVKPEWDFTKRYFEYMKIFSRIYLAGGNELIIDLLNHYLNNDRKYINSYLKKIQDNTLSIKYMPSNQIENFIATYFNLLEPEQITPLEYVIVESLKKPMTIEQISEKIHAPLEITKNALGRLFGKGICVMVKEGIDLNWRKKDLFDQNLIKPIFPL